MKSLSVASLLLIGLMAGFSAEAADLMRGQRVYMSHCLSCHGPNGLSLAPNTPSFARGEGLFQPDMMLLQSVKMGVRTQPPFFGILSDQEILDSIAYARTLRTLR